MNRRSLSIVMAALTLVALSGEVSVASALTKKTAERAVRKKLVRDYPAFSGKTDPVPGLIGSFHYGPSARCHRLTTRQYDCTWTAQVLANGLCGDYHGTATVRQFTYGIRVRTSKPIGSDPCGHDGVKD